MKLPESTPAKAPSAEPHVAGSCPCFLAPAEGYEEWHQCATARGTLIALRFGPQFGIAPELAHLVLLAGAAHFLGESVQVELPHGRLDCAFNLLIVTPEARPAWPGVFLRFPAGGRQQIEQFSLGSSETARKGGLDDFAALQAAAASPEAQRISMARALIRRIPDTILVDSARLPVPCSPLDRRVTLVTPVRGLKAALVTLTAEERVGLEEALLGGRSNEGMPDSSIPAIPAFMWHLPESDAACVFGRHPWLSRVPFLLMHSSEPSSPSLESNSNPVQEIAKLSEVLFRDRLARMRHPKVFQLSNDVACPATKFMTAIERWSTGPGRGLVSLQWLGDLALKFALLMTRLEGSEDLDRCTLVRSVELAKFYGRLHWLNLSRYGLTRVAESADTFALTDRERQIFLRICEKGPLTGAQLRRGFNRLGAPERDEIIARLVAGGFVRISKGGMLQGADF